MARPIAQLWDNAATDPVEVRPLADIPAGMGFVDDLTSQYVIALRDIAAGAMSGAIDSGRFRCIKANPSDSFLVGESLSFSATGVVAGSDPLVVSESSAVGDRYVFAELNPSGSGSGISQRSPEPLTIPSHGLNSTDVQFPRPIAVNNSDVHVVCTTNDQGTQSFQGCAVSIIDANTVGWFPISAFKAAGERMTTGGTLVTGDTYWLQENGTIGTALPLSGAPIPILRANSPTKYDFDGDFFALVAAASGSISNTNIANSSLTQDANYSYALSGFTQSIIGSTWHWTQGFRMSDVMASGPWLCQLSSTGTFRTTSGSTVVEHLPKVKAFLKLTPAQVATSLTWTDRRPVYVDSLTQNRVFRTPLNMTEGELLEVYLRGNSSGFLWDFSNYDFGENNDDGSAFVPVQSNTTTKMDRMTIQRVGNSYNAVWHRGMTHVAPT